MTTTTFKDLISNVSQEAKDKMNESLASHIRIPKGICKCGFCFSARIDYSIPQMLCNVCNSEVWDKGSHMVECLKNEVKE